MRDYGLRPQPPRWALDAGLPAPYDEETFCEYIDRLGLSAGELLQGLSERTVCLANLRLATKLQHAMPRAFEKHIALLVRLHVPEGRRRPSVVA